MSQFQSLDESEGSGSGSSTTASSAADHAVAKPDAGAAHVGKGGKVHDGKSPISGAVFNLANAVRALSFLHIFFRFPLAPSPVPLNHFWLTPRLSALAWAACPTR